MVEREGRGGATWVGGTEACGCVEDGVESGIVETGGILVEEEDVLEEGELAGGKQEVVAGLREASGEEAVKEEAEEVEVEGAGGWNGGARGRVLRQLPESPGRQREQGFPLRAHEHLKHLAVPLQRQQREEATAGRPGATARTGRAGRVSAMTTHTYNYRNK